VRHPAHVFFIGLGAAFRQQLKRTLTGLKRSYQQAYMSLHTRARLGEQHERRRAALLADGRWGRLGKLATVELLPVAQLREVERRLDALRVCGALTAQELESAAICPHCSYVPASEAVGPPASAVLDALDEELDSLVAGWTSALIENLSDSATQEKLGLLKPAAKRLLNDFVKTRQLPDDLGDGFVEAAREALSGLVRLVLKTDDLKAALVPGGTPAAPAELKKRFDEHIDGLARGHDSNKVRVVVE